MPKNYWMVVQTPENHEITKGLGFTLYGLTSRQRRRARRMEQEDRILFYVGGDVKKWSAIANVTSPYFEDRTPIWKSNGSFDEVFPYRVKISPSIVLDEADYIDARILAPRLEYLKRWPPELWPLAFFDTLHLLPQNDFRLIETEMKRFRRGRRGQTRPEPRYEQADQMPQIESENDGSDDIIIESVGDDEPVESDSEDQPKLVETDQSSLDSSSDE
jgi:predicted RNA-binding protein